ncbi:MAG: hypothetical protein RIS22_187, partial [Actinomycetota bacterium]
MSEHQLALVTGASKGLGRQMALGLANAGYKVIAVARSKSDLDLLAQENSDRIFPYVCDVSENRDVEALAAKVKSEH